VGGVKRFTIRGFMKSSGLTSGSAQSRHHHGHLRAQKMLGRGRQFESHRSRVSGPPHRRGTAGAAARSSSGFPGSIRPSGAQQVEAISASMMLKRIRSSLYISDDHHDNSVRDSPSSQRRAETSSTRCARPEGGSTWKPGPRSARSSSVPRRCAARLQREIDANRTGGGGRTLLRGRCP